MALAPAPRPNTRMTPWSWRSLVRSVAGHAVLIALCLLTLFPLWWMVLTAIRPENEWVSPVPFPSAITFDNFAFVWRSIPIANMLVNTLVMAVLITIGQLLICVLAGYAFARWEFRGSRFLFLAFLGTWLVPFQVIMIPNYVLVAQLGWINSIWGLVVPQLATAFGIILMRQHMKSFPRELIDAARIDGAGNWTILWRLMIPNLQAPIAAMGILYFINGWNEYFWPLLVTRRIENTVVQIGLQMFQSQEGNLWGPLMAAASIAALPVFVVYLVLQKQVIEAFVRSGIK